MKKLVFFLCFVAGTMSYLNHAAAKTERVEAKPGVNQIIGYFAIRNGAESCVFNVFRKSWVSKQPKHGTITVRREPVTLNDGRCKGNQAYIYVIRYRGNGQPDRATVAFTGDAYTDDDAPKTWYRKFRINQ